jgi:hypothetical protein
MEHLESQLPAADVTLSGDVLDRIDQIVPPGVTLNPADNGWVSPALHPAARRRLPRAAPVTVTSQHRSTAGGCAVRASSARVS